MTKTKTDDHVCCRADCKKPWHACIERDGTPQYVCENHTPNLCVGCHQRPAKFGVGVIPVFCHACEGGMEETITYREEVGVPAPTDGEYLGEEDAPVCGGVTYEQLTAEEDKTPDEQPTTEGNQAQAPIEDGMRRWFEFEHLPTHLRQTSQPFHQLAAFISSFVKPGRERYVALRKLLEAKDAAVRATLHPGA